MEKSTDLDIDMEIAKIESSKLAISNRRLKGHHLKNSFHATIHVIEGDIGVGKSTLLLRAETKWGLKVVWEDIPPGLVDWMYSDQKVVPVYVLQSMFLNSQLAKYVEALDFIRDKWLEGNVKDVHVLMERGVMGQLQFALHLLDDKQYAVFHSRWTVVRQLIDSHLLGTGLMIQSEIKSTTSYLVGRNSMLLKNIKGRGIEWECKAVDRGKLANLRLGWMQLFTDKHFVKWPRFDDECDLKMHLDNVINDKYIN